MASDFIREETLRSPILKFVHLHTRIACNYDAAISEASKTRKLPFHCFFILFQI